MREPWHLSCHGGLCAIVTGNPTKPVSREVRRRAAVKPRPACFPSSTLRGCAAQSGVKGGERKTQGGLSMGQPGLPLAD